MVEIIGNRRAWVIALILVTMFVGCVATEQIGMFEVSGDNPLGTLRFDELSVALAPDPDREVERIVGHVWRFEGPKRLITRGSALYSPAVDLGIDDSFEYQLYLDFATPRDGSRFKTEEVAIACTNQDDHNNGNQTNPQALTSQGHGRDKVFALARFDEGVPATEPSPVPTPTTVVDAATTTVDPTTTLGSPRTTATGVHSRGS